MKSSSSHFVHLTYIAAQPLGPRDSYRYVSLMPCPSGPRRGDHASCRSTHPASWPGVPQPIQGRGPALLAIERRHPDIGRCCRHAEVDRAVIAARSEEHTSELQSLRHLVCRLLLGKKRK